MKIARIIAVGARGFGGQFPALVALAISMGFACFVPQASAEDSGLAGVREWFAEAASPHLKGYVQLNENYRKALNRLLEAQTQAANLDGAMQIRQEMEAFADGRDFDAAVFRKRAENASSDLRNLQATYVSEHARITANARVPLLAALVGYEERLGQLQDELTRNSQLEEARAVSRIREEIQRSPAEAANAALAATESGSELVKLAAFTKEPVSDGMTRGNLLLIVKGEVEIFHNGRRVTVKNQANHKSHFHAKIPERAFKAGDSIVLRVRSPYAFRAVAAAIKVADKPGLSSIKNAHWRYLGANKDGSKITAEDIASSQERLGTGTPDNNGADGREALGLPPVREGGSDWVKTQEQLNGWYCIGFLSSRRSCSKGRDAGIRAKCGR